MKSGKKFMFGFLPTMLCLMVLLLSACGGGGSTGPTSNNQSSTKPEASADKQIFRYPVVGDVATLDPALVEDTDSNFPIQALFTGLVTLDDSLAVKPELADHWDVSSDGKTYTFTLKNGVKFSDGSPLTAQDVVYSINRTVLPATKSSVSYYLSLLQDFDKVQNGKIPTLIGDSLIAQDDKTVVIKISKNAPYFLYTLSYPTSYVVKKDVVEKYGGKWIDHIQDGAGSGPFKMASYSHQTGIDLVPNENYYGPKPKLQHLNIPFYTDQDGMYKAYQAKQIDYSPVPPAHIASEKNSPGYRDIPLLVIRYFTMNYLIKPFDNIKIRQAFALALNKDAIVSTTLRGAYTPTNHLIPQGMQGYYADLKGPDGTTNTAGNADKAKQLLQQGLQEEGLSSLPPVTLTFYPRNQGFKDAINAAVQMWQTTLNAKINVNIIARARLLSLEDATKNNPNGLQLWQAGWSSDYPDPQDWTSTFFSKGADYNQMNYGQNNSKNAADQQAVQEKLAQADVTNDPTARLKLYYDAEQQIVNDVAWIPLWQEKIQSLTRTTVQNLVINAQDQIPPTDWGKIYISQ